jgi:UDP-glucuronate 4-epimerase
MEAYIDVNIKGTQRLLDWMVKIGCKKFVFASSSSVYGNSSVPFTETADVNTPVSPYAFTKKSGELLTHNFYHLYGIDVLNLRFFTVIGERQRPDLAIHKFVKAILADEPITLYGDGQTSRDYTYVKDTARGVFLAYNYLMNHSGVYDTLNIGNSKPVSLLQMVETLEKVLEKKAIVQFDNPKPGDVEKTYADISKAEKLIGYKPETSFENGVRSFVTWYKTTLLKP